jgi:hypothetical protein
MSDPVFYAVFSKNSEISLYWQCVCLAHFVEAAAMVADAWRLQGAAATVRIVTQGEALVLFLQVKRQGRDGFRFSDIPGARFDEHEEEGEE